MKINLRESISKTLHELGNDNHYEEGELGYLSLTSKNEFVIRDRLAYKLHKSLSQKHSKLLVGREVTVKKNRLDIAVLKGDNVICSVELKSSISADLVDAKRLKHCCNVVRMDIRKSEKVISQGSDPLGLLVCTHIENKVQDKFYFLVKYSKETNTALKIYRSGDPSEDVKQQVLKNVKSRFSNSRKYAIIDSGEWDGGVVPNMGYKVRVLWWLIGKK